jgi:ankyrin repeat protein
MPTAGTKLQSVSEKKSVKVELFEASKDSEWFDAIEKKNCKLLLQHFRSDRSLWVQTGLAGRSVLHVAVMQGCSELVRELHYYDGDLVPCGKNWQTPFEFLWENARDGRLKDASAQDIWLVMEGPSVKIGNQELDDRELSTDRSRDDYIKSHVECTMRVDDEMLSLRDAIHSIADEKDFRRDENDVDFNFEHVERKEFYVHMACSRLRNVARNVHKEEDWKTSGCDQIVEFIIAIFTDLGGKNLLQKLFDQKDAQGRTVLQILVLCEDDGVCMDMLTSAFKEMLEILPDACVNALDKAGRTLLLWAVAHRSNWALKELLESGKARRDVTFQTAHMRNITAFHLILLYDHKLPNYYHPHLKVELKRDFFDFGVIDYDFRRTFEEYRLLQWAIQMDRNKFVKVVMQTKVICPHLFTSLTLTLICSIV